MTDNIVKAMKRQDKASGLSLIRLRGEEKIE